MLTDGRIAAVNTNLGGDSVITELMILTKTPVSELPEKEIIEVASIMSSSILREQTSVVGEKQGWTIPELIAFLNEHPDSDILYHTTNDDFMTLCVSFNLDSFIDLEAGSCHFDEEAFKEILELANRFPSNVDYDNAPSYEDRILEQTLIQTVDGYQEEQAKYQELVTFIGYPTPDGRSGNGIQAPDGVYAITSQSKHKEGAWEFLEMVFTTKNEGLNALPIYKKELEEQCDTAAIGRYAVLMKCRILIWGETRWSFPLPQSRTVMKTTFYATIRCKHTIRPSKFPMERLRPTWKHGANWV
jgi:hypothetical protein